MSQQSYKAYAAATQTVAKTKQVIMLFDATIKQVHLAKEAIAAGDIQARYNALVKACEILFGLQGSLDFEQGGDVAKTLYDFYASADARLMSVHRNNDPAMCEQVIKELRMMRDAWIDIDKIDENNNASVAPNADQPAALASSNVPPQGGVTISA